MKPLEFVAKVNSKSIENGTKFDVYDTNNQFLGTLGVIDTTIVYLTAKQMPNDVLVNENYVLIEQKKD